MGTFDDLQQQVRRMAGDRTAPPPLPKARGKRRRGGMYALGMGLLWLVGIGIYWAIASSISSTSAFGLEVIGIIFAVSYMFNTITEQLGMIVSLLEEIVAQRETSTPYDNLLDD